MINHPRKFFRYFDDFVVVISPQCGTLHTARYFPYSVAVSPQCDKCSIRNTGHMHGWLSHVSHNVGALRVISRDGTVSARLVY